jgi:hypothetical protein
MLQIEGGPIIIHYIMNEKNEACIVPTKTSKSVRVLVKNRNEWEDLEDIENDEEKWKYIVSGEREYVLREVGSAQ